ncbi:sterol 3-beta-glucosyltransferase, partial [Ascoidea rubescens DSM 1968]
IKEGFQNVNEKKLSKALSLSSKLASTFNIDPDDEFLDDFSCWLLRDVLLQGHLYITKSFILFFAYLPKLTKDSTIFDGNLSTKRNYNSKLKLKLISQNPISSNNRYWCVLKNSTFSTFNNSSDLYFPLLTIDLRYAIRVEIIPNAPNIEDDQKPCWFRIFTETKTYKFKADNLYSARQWVAALKKQIFTARNKGDIVTVKLPISNLIDLEETSIFEDSETIRLKVLENSKTFAVDDYFFMFFHNGHNVINCINQALSLNNLPNFELSSGSTESSPVILSNSTIDDLIRSKNLSSILSSSRQIIPVEEKIQSLVSINRRQRALGFNISIDIDSDNDICNRDNRNEISEILNSGYEDSDVNEVESSNENDDLLTHKNRFLGNTGTKALQIINPKNLVKNMFVLNTLSNVSGMWTAEPSHYEEKNSLERGLEDEYFVASEIERKNSIRRFQSHFSLPEGEKLISTYYAHFQRNIPLYGKIYLGSNEICFRSLIPGTNTKMILPFNDIETCYKEKGFRFGIGYSGLVIVIHAHEELFFEFSSSESRDDCETLLLKQIDLLKNYNYRFNNYSFIINNNSGKEEEDIKLAESVNNQAEAARIKCFENKLNEETGFDLPIIIEDKKFKEKLKPNKNMHFTLLTIGSRGDVQPYLALGRGLLKEGHKVRIATHKEFEKVVLSNGIEFREVSGDPTKLMSFMGDHGGISVSFIKDGKALFSNWINELLESSWEACQGTDVLIESPSAMAGIHIAEALCIPYFRAFTMPWTRTRAYPHAFIVPEQKMGGSYNYLTHIIFETVFWKGISGQVNRWRKERLGLERTNLELMQQNKVPFLYNISPTVFPSPVDFSDWVKVTGYWFLNEGTDYIPTEKLKKFINKARRDKKKLVYIGFGSIVVNDPRELTRAIVEAVVDSDVRCILNKGWSGRNSGTAGDERKEEEDGEGEGEEEEALPACIYSSGSVPHDWLFFQVDAAVHHGGSGTTGASLRAGLPTVVKPFFGDQFFYGNRVEDIGVGVSLKKLNSRTLGRAIREVTTSKRIIEKARAIGEKIRKENGVETAIGIIYGELDYARNLILAK